MKTFEELGVSEEIRRAIEELGFENPMPVQEEVIPYLLGNKNDVIALAQTGTGKTASYGIPVIQKTDASNKQTQAIILSPTRELCLQIADDLNSFAKYIDGLHIAAVYGGTDIGSQIRTLKHGVQIIVATPGRLLDLINRGVAQLENVNNVVLDEADEMLNMGFSESINAIFENVPEDRNTLLFSATMSKDIEKIALNYLHDHKEIVVGSRNEGAEHVNHIYYLVNAKDKYLALKRVVDFYPRIFAIIFCRTKLETQDIADKLIKDGYNAEALHGDLSQQQRDLTMQKFRNHTVQFLVATDVAARGLDVEDLTHVINYGLPDDVASYTHRSGRTGRAGKKGTSISIIHTREKFKVRQIEKQIGKEFGTDFAMQMLIDTQPKYFSDLVRIAGLAHGTDVWLGNAQTLIQEGKATIQTAICTRDDIMIYLISMGLEEGLSFTIMESVRKGKGLKPEWEEEMTSHGVPDWYIWSCKKIKYMFPKAHAAAYVMMAWRIAYCKVFYPLAYYAAFFSIRANGFSYELMCQGRDKLEYYLADYRKRMDTLSKKEQDTLRDMRIVQEMYARGYDFTPIDIYQAKARHFQIIGGKLMPSLSSIDGLGEKAADAVVDAVKDGRFLSKEDFRNRTKVSKTVCDLMGDLGLLGELPESNQLSLFDF